MATDEARVTQDMRVTREHELREALDEHRRVWGESAVRVRGGWWRRLVARWLGRLGVV